MVAASGSVHARGPSTTIVAVLQTHDRRIELHPGARVTVRNNQGELVAEDLTLGQLAERDPFLYDVCRASFANNGDPYMDARLDTQQRDAPKAIGLLGD